MYLILAFTFLASFTATVLGLIVYMKNNSLLIQPISKFVKGHQHKEGTQTSAGIVIFISFIATFTLMLSAAKALNVAIYDSNEVKIYFSILIGLVFFIIGAFDDIVKSVSHNNTGITIKARLLFELLATLFIFMVMYRLGITDYSISRILLFTLIIVGSANAFNMLDGIDGGLCSALIPLLLGLIFMSFLKGNGIFIILLLSVLSSICGFYMFNIKPAKVFMGDSGSLFIGGMLASIAIALNIKVVFGIMSILPVITIFAVTLQVIGYKLFKYRVFGFVPFHHFAERLGMSEAQIADLTFSLSSIAAIVGCMIGLIM